MFDDNVENLLNFLRRSERLKNTLRSSYTSTGKQESVAEHTWRLCLMVLLLEDEFPDLDIARLLKMCIIHDLGEAINGDIPAPAQTKSAPKSVEERNDFLQLMKGLPGPVQEKMLALWDEYEQAETPEAKVAKALDKLETIMQHNQGENPEDFDYSYNLEYGKKYTTGHPLIETIRNILDEETRTFAKKSGLSSD